MPLVTDNDAPPPQPARNKRQRARPPRPSTPAPRGNFSLPATAEAPPDPARVLTNRLPPGKTPDEATADLIAGGIATNGWAALTYSKGVSGLGITELVGAIRAAAQQVQAGDLSGPEGLLVAQATTLNAIFTDMVCRSSKVDRVDRMELYLRLGLKAQGQCRATLEALTVLKNPPVFARQANITSGPQQVNNSVLVETAAPMVLARAADTNSRQTKLLEEQHEAPSRLDTRTSRRAGRGYQEVAPVGPLDGSEQRGR